MSTKSFQRRYYPNLRAFLQDFQYLRKQRDGIRQAMRTDISPAFRERLMLTVTEVNGCKYCSYYHARAALASGLSAEELQQFLQGSIAAQAPADEVPALLYAQHWAEQNAQPDPQIKARLIAQYGEPKSRAIEIVLRMIRMGNLLGNTLDYFLFRISFGIWGIRRDEARFQSSR